MNWFDIFVAILLLRTGYIGFKNGLSAEIYKAASLVFSGLAAFYFYKKLVLIINQYMITLIPEGQLRAISFISIFILAMLILKLLFILVQKIMQLSFAKPFDTTLGMASGLCRGVLIICLLFTILSWASIDYMKNSITQKSFSGQYVVTVNDQIKNILLKLKIGGLE